jgi:hypothetical protein
MRRPSLPKFWLIMKVNPDAVTTYFHCRYKIKEIHNVVKPFTEVTGDSQFHPSDPPCCCQVDSLNVVLLCGSCLLYTFSKLSISL